MTAIVLFDLENGCGARPVDFKNLRITGNPKPGFQEIDWRCKARLHQRKILYSTTTFS
ncbi:MAG: hypothetical protein R3D58_08370 [Saprospiraceae bacterium]